MVERKNSSLIEHARAILNELNLLTYFWDNAVGTTCYVSNQVIITPILKITPHELFKGIKPNISYFPVFECKLFVLNNEKYNLGKFNEKFDEGILLGYSV